MSYLRMQSLVFFLFTCLLAVLDIRKRAVPLWMFAVMAGTGAVLSLLEKRELLPFLSALLPGIFLLFAGILTEGGIGIGDGLYLLTGAFFLNGKELCILLSLSFTLAAFAALVLLVKRSPGQKKTLPFLAFFPVSFLLYGGLLL